MGYREVRFNGKHVHLQVVLLTQYSHYQLFFGRELGEKLPFDALVTDLGEQLVLPSHGVDEVESRGDKAGLIVANEVVAALTIGRTDSSGK